MPEQITPHPDPPPQRGREILSVASGGGELEATANPGCPLCRSNDTDVISLFGSQVMTMQCKCRACGNFFEASKY